MDDVFKEGSDDFGFGFNDRCGGELSASGCEFIALSRSLKLRTAFLHFAFEFLEAYGFLVSCERKSTDASFGSEKKKINKTKQELLKKWQV